MNASKAFIAQIKGYLDSVAEKDILFAETLKKPNKNINECVNYIFSTVQKSGNNGFADQEIYDMAVHYYDEDDIKDIKAPANVKVVVNHVVELTEEDKAEAHKIAMAK